MATLLLLDADRRLLDRYRTRLETAGHSVLVAGEAAAGLERLREGGVEAIVVDGDATYLDTLVSGLLRLPDPPPIVFISRALDAPTLSARIGASAFLLEPCDPVELLMVIDRIVVGPVPETVDEAPTRPLQRE